ncbi:MAG: acyl carrier protein [Actinomycetota bacterium]|nr:acyl carrier protein [Actinomycetota bacterium]
MQQGQGADERSFSSIKSAIHDFISRAFKGRPLADNEDIFATGFVNSLFAMELITFVEGTFRISIESEDLDLENFSTVERLAGLVAGKLGAPAAWL